MTISVILFIAFVPTTVLCLKEGEIIVDDFNSGKSDFWNLYGTTENETTVWYPSMHGDPAPFGLESIRPPSESDNGGFIEVLPFSDSPASLQSRDVYLFPGATVELVYWNEIPIDVEGRLTALLVYTEYIESNRTEAVFIAPLPNDNDSSWINIIVNLNIQYPSDIQLRIDGFRANHNGTGLAISKITITNGFNASTTTTTSPTTTTTTASPTPSNFQDLKTTTVPSQETTTVSTQESISSSEPTLTPPEPFPPEPITPSTLKPSPEPEPSTTTPEPEPSTTTPEPEPITTTPEPEPSTTTPEPKPEPSTSTPEPEPEPSTSTPDENQQSTASSTMSTTETIATTTEDISTTKPSVLSDKERNIAIGVGSSIILLVVIALLLLLWYRRHRRQKYLIEKRRLETGTIRYLEPIEEIVTNTPSGREKTTSVSSSSTTSSTSPLVNSV